MLSVRERPQKKMKEKIFETAYIINKFFILFFLFVAQKRETTEMKQ